MFVTKIKGYKLVVFNDFQKQIHFSIVIISIFIYLGHTFKR